MAITTTNNVQAIQSLRTFLEQLARPTKISEPRWTLLLMRHASIDMTTKYGRNSMLNVTLPANTQVVEMVMRKDAGKKQKGNWVHTLVPYCSLAVSG